MSGCMGTDKPQISILMAVYEPRMDWLKLQLESLEAQTYPNVKLYIRDDCSPTVPYEEIEKCVAQCIRSFPYELKRNEINVGSNATFECLTQEADGAYFAYCDQDDVWLPEKLNVLQEELEKSGAQLVCSDMFIIDGEGKRIASSITRIRRHHVFRSGEGLTDTLWYSNFASGCALLVRAETAKDAIPFNPHMYYDHYITLYSANEGKVISLLKPLLEHREHGNNQSSSMQGIVDKKSYIHKRVDNVVDAVQWLTENFPCEESLRQKLSQGLIWMKARQGYLRGNRGQAGMIWQYRSFSPMASLFEIAMPYMPNSLFRLSIWASKNNCI